jgi:hypothetical protein
MDNMRRISFLLVLSLGLACSGGTAIADTLLVESVQSAPAVARPAHGMVMEQVLQQHGEPQQRLGPVGEPPISHWVYDGFIVYFEHQHVIHSVVPR